MMLQRVLFVDDEPNVLEGIQRMLRKQVEVVTASSGADALRLMREGDPFALIVSDMRMPVMNGAQLLAKAREHCPDTVRMILSGQADLQATIAAVNEGHIYRFLNKPCSPEQLSKAVEEGLAQYRLVTMEKVLLEETLNGSIRMLVEILGMVRPAASNRATRLHRYVTDLAAQMKLAPHWQWSLAALVSQIGCVAFSSDILSKAEAGQGLSEEERRLYESHPEVTGKLLSAIPRLEDVAAIVTAQFEPIHWRNAPPDISSWNIREIGRLLLRAAIEFERLITRGASREIAVETLRASPMAFPAAVISALSAVPASKQERVIQIGVQDLSVGMILDEDLLSPKGIRLVPAGQEVTLTLIVRLKSIAAGVGVAEPFRVKVYR
jgi:response regulator RpfG family c-di-GMP phosphodiesterase